MTLYTTPMRNEYKKKLLYFLALSLSHLHENPLYSSVFAIKPQCNVKVNESFNRCYSCAILYEDIFDKLNSETQR